MTSNVDLRELASTRDNDRSPTPLRSRNLLRLWTRTVMPITLLAGVAALLAWSARESFLPATSVTVMPAVPHRSQSAAPETLLFQAAGWVEPRPTPILVTALAEGVVETLDVVEGQEVHAGEEVATLVDEDAALLVRQAEAALALREAELRNAEAQLEAARTRLAEPVQLELPLSEADAALTDVEIQISRIPHQIASGRARVELARQDVETKKNAADAVSLLARQRAESELAVAEATLRELQAHDAALEQRRDALRKQRDVLHRQFTLKVDEIEGVAAAEAKFDAAQATVREAEALLDAEKLRLQRMTIRSPVDGRVLELVARPGSRVTGAMKSPSYDSSTVITLYQPDRLQVRADVRLEDVPEVQVGQPVHILTPAVRSAMTGKVLAATGLTDIQKNTLQVKVSIDDPPPTLKPDMLVEVRFLSPPRPSDDDKDQSQWSVMIPNSLIMDGEHGPAVWIADQSTGRARLSAIEVTPKGDGELVEVRRGVKIGDRLIVSGRESLSDGERIRIIGVDESMGNDSTDAQKESGRTKPSRL